MSRLSKLLMGSAFAIALTALALPSRRRASPSEVSVPAAPPAPQESLEIPLHAASEAQLAAQTARSASLAWGRDPFASPARPQAGLAEPLERAFEAAPPPVPAEPVAAPVRPRLTGLSERGAERWAIIDGEIVREGDALGSGHVVARIERRSVTVLMHSEELTLELGERP